MNESVLIIGVGKKSYDNYQMINSTKLQKFIYSFIIKIKKCMILGD